MNRPKKFLAVPLALAATLTFTACSSDSDSDTTNGNTDTNTSAPAEDTGPPEPVAEVDMLTGVDTAVALDAAFVEALGTLSLTPAPLGDAAVSAEGVASFPITGGDVTYYDPAEDYRPYVQGEILHEGSGLSLTSADGTVVELTDFVIDPGDPAQLSGTVAVNGEVAAESAVLFDLNGNTLEPLQVNDDGTAVLTGTEVLLNEGAAQLLNDTFGVDALAGGLLIGISTITINT